MSSLKENEFNTDTYRILMVCLGNICRSSLAKGILQSKINTLQLKNVFVDAAGTSNFHQGEYPDRRAIEIGLKNDIDISKQKSKPFLIENFDSFNKIYVMDKANYSTIIGLARNKQDKEKVQLVLNVLTPNLDNEVPDPYYGGDKGFEKVYKLLNKACVEIIQNIEV